MVLFLLKDFIIINMNMNLDIYPLSKNFKTCGAKDHPFFWIHGASNFVDNLNECIKITGYKPKILETSDYQNDRSEELKNIFKYEGSDKFIHDYYMVYSNLLCQMSNINLLEIGLGTKNPDIPSTMFFYLQDINFNSTPCSSIRSFKKFLNDNSNIYGADIDNDILISEPGIKCEFVDQLNPDTLKKLFEGINFDFVIIDGLHHISSDLNSIIYLIDRVNSGGYFIIEDISILDNWIIIDFILSKNKNLSETFFVKCDRNQYMYVLKK